MRLKSLTRIRIRWIRIGFASWIRIRIRIRIEIKSCIWIRICIEANADPQHRLEDNHNNFIRVATNTLGEDQEPD